MGFYGSVFFKSWLVVAQNVEGPREKQPKVSMIVSAVTAEDACDKVRSYLSAEGFKFGPVAAFFG
ncbi:MAG: hypothetical protein JWM80_1602 [Cyanobacteria bacterium RYN_339]|nr:hypothetical protein [Cyanobacteria bacterium RYN_339]